MSDIAAGGATVLATAGCACGRAPTAATGSRSESRTAGTSDRVKCTFDLDVGIGNMKGCLQTIANIRSGLGRRCGSGGGVYVVQYRLWAGLGRAQRTG